MNVCIVSIIINQTGVAVGLIDERDVFRNYLNNIVTLSFTVENTTGGIFFGSVTF